MSDKDLDDRFKSIIKTFEPKTLFRIEEFEYKKRKQPDITTIHEQIMKMDNAIIDSDVIESVLKEF